MPTLRYGLLRLVAASGLFVLVTISAALAQEPPVDPTFQDVPLAEQTEDGLQPVAQLAEPAIDYEQCLPAPAAWHPPIYFPSPEIYCPTGVVCRDWLREHTVPFAASRRQKMLEEDYAWRAQNGHQPVCCPPHSNWGHKCNECSWKVWDLFGSDHGSCAPCNRGCGTNAGCQLIGDETSAVESQDGGIQLAGYFEESESESQSEIQLASDRQESEIQLVSDRQPAGETRPNVEPAGFCTVKGSCTTGCTSAGCRNGHCNNGHCWNGHCLNGHFNNGRHCWLGPNGGWGWWNGRGHGHYCPLHKKWCYDDECDECEDDRCHCPLCCWKHLLYGDCPGGGGWHREIPPFCHYNMAYPVNPYHFDQRDGRIYAAQGYGHPVGVPLAPNVEHAYNYGWGVPSSRLTPVSRMPGAPGVANPAVPGAAGPGIFPPAFPTPISGGWGQ